MGLSVRGKNRLPRGLAKKAVRFGVEDNVRIFVGNLSFKAMDDDVRAAFEPFGSVTSVEVMKERETGRSRGFAFVDMPNAEEANAAMSAVNGQSILGRPVRVNEAQARTPRR